MRRLLVLVMLALLISACAGGAGGDDAASDGEAGARPGAPRLTTIPEPTVVAESSTSTEAPVEPVAPAVTLQRGVWVHLFDPTLKTPAGVEELLTEAEAAGLDSLFVQVARRHDAYYRSAHLPPTPDPELAAGFDVLGAVIEGARTRGIQVHAWFVVAPAYHREYDGLLLPVEHVWVRHGPGSDESWMTVDVEGIESREYLDVGLPVVRAHVAAIVSDIARQYEVDGIHLDYVRYDGSRFGYHPVALALFHAETGRSDRPAPDDPEWSAWRRARTAELVAEAKAALGRERPEAQLSAAVIAGGEGPASSPGGFAGTRAASQMLQDWPRWLDDGLVDLVVLMAYMREANPEHARWYRQWVEFAAELSERHPGRVAVGVGGYLSPLEGVLAQLSLAQQQVGPVVVYSYQQDSADQPRGALLRAWPLP